MLISPQILYIHTTQATEGGNCGIIKKYVLINLVHATKHGESQCGVRGHQREPIGIQHCVVQHKMGIMVVCGERVPPKMPKGAKSPSPKVHNNIYSLPQEERD